MTNCNEYENMVTGEQCSGVLLQPCHWKSPLSLLSPEECYRVLQALMAEAGADCTAPEDLSPLESMAVLVIKTTPHTITDEELEWYYAANEAAKNWYDAKGGEQDG